MFAAGKIAERWMKIMKKTGESYCGEWNHLCIGRG